MKKRKILFNLITLALTTGLLVMITVAWYAVNQKASVEAGTGSVADLDNIVDTVEYYNFIGNYKEGNNTVYKVKNYVYKEFGDNPDEFQIDFTYDGNKALTGETDAERIQFSMNEYDFLTKDVSKYLIKIKLLPGKSLSNLQFISTATYFIGFSSNPDSDGSLDNVDSLSMSSIIEFGCFEGEQVPTIRSSLDTSSNELENAEVIINNTPTMNHFEFGTGVNEYSGAITTSKKTITPANASTLTEFYLLIDYNEDAINAFFSYNLQSRDDWGSEGHGTHTAPQFNIQDFKIFLLG